MKINLDYYKEDIPYNVGEEEDKVIEYINKNTPSNYEEILEKDTTDEVILALSTERSNIVYAYDFNKDGKLLEIGAHLGEITSSLCRKVSKVFVIETVKKRAEAIAKRCKKRNNLEIYVGNIPDIKLEEKFDYITLFGILEYSSAFFKKENPALEMIKYCKNMLKEDGKLLIATNNKFAMKSYVGEADECTKNSFDSITGYKSSNTTFKLGKKEIERILEESGLEFYKFFYPLPDYKLADKIYTDEYLPSSTKINAYLPYYSEKSNIFYSEVDAYDAIIKEDKNLFKHFANSFFIEASKKEIKNDAKFITFNNYRKKQYRLMTKIRENVVEKEATVKDSKQHLENMKKNIDELKKDNVLVLDNYDNEKIISKFINQKLVSQQISDRLEDKDYIIELFKKYKNDISKNSHFYSKNEKTIFDKFDIKIDNQIKSKFMYIENAYWDMIFKNCFMINQQFYYIDQEWVESNVPVEFLVYRCIVNIEKLRSKIEEYKLFEELEINEYIDVFKELDQKLFEQILDKKIFKLYTRRYNNPIYQALELQHDLNLERNTTKELRKSIQSLSNEIYEKNDKINQLSEQVELYKSKSIKSKIKRIFKNR